MRQRSNYASLCEKLGLSASLDEELLSEAFLHGSTSAGNQNLGAEQVKNYQRLEFLGDSVLGLLAAELLYENHQDAKEGVLSRLRSELVSGDVFAELAEVLDLQSYIKLGPSIREVNPKILAETFEALCGAIFLSCGFETTKAVFLPILHSKLVDLLKSANSLGINATSFDAKTMLQEFFQTNFQERPSYQLVETIGPAHSPVFKVRCVFRGETLGVASAKTKKIAEKESAKMAYGKIGRYGLKGGKDLTPSKRLSNPANTFLTGVNSTLKVDKEG